MKTFIFLSVAAAAGAGLFMFPSSAQSETRDPKAVAEAKREMEASGAKHWEKARYIRFDFSVDAGTRHSGPIAHYWDRYTGRYRLDVPGEKGFRAYFNVQKPADFSQAVILKGNARVTGPDAEALLKRAYGRFINDTYWMLAPLKVLDPGVNLADEGEVEFDGKKAHVIRLSFGAVGLTPGDVYKHFLDPATGQMLGWEYKLQGETEGPTRWKWEDVKEFGGLRLSQRKTQPGGETIRTDNIMVSGTVDEAALTPPGE